MPWLPPITEVKNLRPLTVGGSMARPRLPSPTKRHSKPEWAAHPDMLNTKQSLYTTYPEKGFRTHPDGRAQVCIESATPYHGVSVRGVTLWSQQDIKILAQGVLMLSAAQVLSLPVGDICQDVEDSSLWPCSRNSPPIPFFNITSKTRCEQKNHHHLRLRQARNPLHNHLHPDQCRSWLYCPILLGYRQERG